MITPRRFPLYAKIMGWFFLNVVLLAVVLVILFHAQFRFGLDWLLSDRIDAVNGAIGTELASEPMSEWRETMNQLPGNYGNRVKFLLFGGDGNILAGASTNLPPEVKEQVGRRPMPLPQRSPAGGRPPRENDFDGPPEGPPHEHPPEFRGLAMQPHRFIHTSNPSRYWVVHHIPMRGRGGPVTLIAVSDSFAGGGLFFDVGPWLGIGAGAILFSMLLWFPLVRNMTRSITQMTVAANQIAVGRFDVRVDDRRSDELGALGQSINQMAARLNDLVAGQKRFLGDVAHELVSPLAKLRVALGILEQQSPELQQPYVAGAEEEAAHMANLVDELLSFSKASLAMRSVTLKPVSVRNCAERAVHREVGDDAHIEMEIPDTLFVSADNDLVVRAISNLLRNVVRYAGQAGPILLAAHRNDADITLSVTDSGPGVPEAELARIFDPFYRVDPSRDRTTGGVGLGLAIVKTCVESCGGTVKGRNRQPSGLEVIIRLPAATAPAPETPGPNDPGA